MNRQIKQMQDFRCKGQARGDNRCLYMGMEYIRVLYMEISIMESLYIDK